MEFSPSSIVTLLMVSGASRDQLRRRMFGDDWHLQCGGWIGVRTLAVQMSTVTPSSTQSGPGQQPFVVPDEILQQGFDIKLRLLFDHRAVYPFSSFSSSFLCR